MNDEVLQLVACQRAEFARAARFRFCMWIAQLAIAMSAIAAVFFDDAASLLIIALLGLIALGLWAHFDHSYGRCRSLAGRARRAVLVMGGLEQPVSQAELLSIKEALSTAAKNADAYRDPSYFASKSPPGYRRLGEMIQESAFWTSRLQRDSAAIMWVAFIASFAVGGVCLALAIALFQEDGPSLAARVVIAVLSLLLTTDVLGAARAHSAAATSIDRIVTRIGDAEGRGYPQADILMIFSDYIAVVEAAPIAVPSLYASKRDRLEALYGEFQLGRDRVARATSPS